MSRQARRNLTTGFRAEVTTKGDKALSDLARMFEVHANQIRADFRGDGRCTRRAP